MKAATPPSTPVEHVRPGKIDFLVLAILLALPIAIEYLSQRWAFPTARSWIASAATTSLQEQRFALVVACVLAIVLVCSVALAAWFWVMSARIRRAAVFPPVGYLVLVKTAVLRGTAAKRQARAHAIYGFLAITLCVGFIVSIFVLFPLAPALWRLVTSTPAF
ncbi:hypothetical protein [Paucibacter soli]|uniref:hypothetical protein n=1 Tax=Paucibacter soli TaxID=3133433 RepID=UPI0030B3BA6A